ncbi:hypothetical protein CEK29_12610 [Bordetella genomosp. 5]|uniref:hypothetical protein n=1 Tax=Bordetella genomosp. 5 TaxID=1395608 RepID=UPI000B9EE4BF|nr:hypothetical protein [Bordetella genomosp. 5]OZI42580.1 hypothetical protein CEK29_12610 [Bordetella genomosp. 5]
MRSTRLLAGILLAAGASSLSFAAPTTFLNYTIINNIPKQDRAGFRSAVAQALNDSADGQTTTWTSSPPRRGTPISVTLTPRQTSQTEKADKCRFLQAHFEQSGGKENWSFWFCRQPDGGWKASSH